MTKTLAIILTLIASAAHAEIIRKECQTDSSKGLRLTSEAMYRAAKDSEPYYSVCNGCISTRSIALDDSMRVTAERFRSEGRAALLKARAIEASQCPQWERAIMDVAPATPEEKTAVATEYEAQMKKETEKFVRLKQWQVDHPQCERVTVFSVSSWNAFGGQSGTSPGSKEDFSGNFEGKKGQCSADSNGEWWRGSKDDLTNHNPDSNPLIAKVKCADALAKIGLGEGSYADPKLCAR